MLVTIEGVVNSDVLGEGDRRTVEWTTHLRAMVQAGLVRVTAWHHPTTNGPEDAAEPAAAEHTPASKRVRGRRNPRPNEQE